MKDEIKEILDDLRTYKDRYEYFLFNNLSFSDRDYKAKILLDYITNLQEELEEQKRIEQASLDTINNLQEENEDLKKIPEKLDLYDEGINILKQNEYVNARNSIHKSIISLECKYNQLIDYLKSKGE